MVLKRITIKYALSTLLVLVMMSIAIAQYINVEIYDPYGGAGSKPLPDRLGTQIIEALTDSTGSGTSGMLTVGLPWGTKIIEYKALSQCSVVPRISNDTFAYTAWRRVSSGEDTYYGFRAPYLMLGTIGGWERELGGGPSLRHDNYIFSWLDMFTGGFGSGCSCGPMDTSEAHDPGVAYHFLDMAVFIKSGEYKLKGEISNKSGFMVGSLKSIFDGMNDDEAGFDIPAREDYFLEADVFFDKTKSGWNDWLPTAPLEDGDAPGLFPIHMGLTGQGDSYKLRVNLRNITCYPGGWTNDYNDIPTEVPDNNRIDPNEWYESLSYRGCNIEEFCDFKIEKKYNEDNGWNFRFVNYADPKDEGYGSDFPGWYEAEYTKEV
jgi:hypothetical protein